MLCDDDHDGHGDNDEDGDEGGADAMTVHALASRGWADECLFIPTRYWALLLSFIKLYY